MNRLTLSTGLAALGLLFLVAGCVIQVRPDGGLRIDLPPMIPVTLIANGPVSPTVTVTATATLTGTPVMTGTVTPTATQPTTATPTLIATAPTAAATPITATATTTATVPATATATVTATATITTTGTPQVTPTGVMTATGTPTPPTGTPGTPVTGTPRTSTPAPGTRTAMPTATTPTPTATTMRSATPTLTRVGTGTPGTPVTGTPTGSATGTVTATPGTPTPATPPATPTAIPGTVFLSNHRGYVADGAYYVVGEVMNGESFPVFNTKVIASFYDANNNLVGAQESTTLLARIDTEISSPFKLSIPDSGNIDHYELTLVWDEISIIDSQELTILSQEARTDGQLEIVGELRNDGSVTVSNIVVVVTFYDETGAVIDVYQGTVSKPDVARDETAGYTITIPNAELDYDHFTVQAQGSLMLF